ncbi:MAG: hypothetical protein H6728_10835 [Myxococcales bacterium]|nr:hypothetical protein [Myxococcales bacterium]MCB9643555.1 hypothetical protein [Myxococcales bacterium]
MHQGQMELWSRWGTFLVVVGAAALMGTFCGLILFADVFEGIEFVAFALVVATASRLGVLTVWLQRAFPGHPMECWLLVLGTAGTAFVIRILPLFVG